jgi:CHAT domain-containing protein
LPPDDGHYLLQRYEIDALTSGRELLYHRRWGARSQPVLLGNPAFGPLDTAGAMFSPLPDSECEVRAIAKSVVNPTVLVGKEATEDRLRDVQGPRILHLATHGFFGLPNCYHPRPDAADDPLLLSGLALADANACGGGQSDGILTAREASAMDLVGTQMVVAAACKGAFGFSTAGDGIYGLRRAFASAGAESELLALWDVDSVVTTRFMVRYYQLLFDGAGRGEAARQTQLELLGSAATAHPHFWGGYVFSGDASPLDRKGLAVPSTHGACGCATVGAQQAGASAGCALVAVVFLSARRRRGARP